MILKNLLIFVILLGIVLTVSSNKCPHTASGLTKISTFKEWNQENGVIVIKKNTKVLVDVAPSSKKLKSISVYGTLLFDNRDMHINVDFIKVFRGGSFIIGAEKCTFHKKIRITFHGKKTLNSEMGKDAVDGHALGSKGFAAETGSTVHIFGSIPRLVWTRLSRTATKGSRNIYLSGDLKGWSAGMKIAIASTDFGPVTYGNNKRDDQSEDFTIKSINKDMIELDAPLKYTHWSSGYEKAEVGLLTRSIVFEGDETSENDRYGGHFMIRAVEECKIYGAEFYRMGQGGVVGRYPVHFHLLGDYTKKSDKVYLKHSSMHINFQRCAVIHDSQGILIENNVGYDTFGHCYFLEDGGERYNTFKNNLGMKVHRVREKVFQIIPTDDSPSVFWIVNPTNYFVGNVAVGGRFGFWYSLPSTPIGLSASKYKGKGINPREAPFGSFDDNVAHSSYDTGLEVDTALAQDGRTEFGAYNPKEVAHFKNFVTYKHRKHGVWTRGGPHLFTNAVSLDNRFGMNCVPGKSLVENSLIIGETDNIGNPTKQEGERSRPDDYEYNAEIIGYETYDNFGPQFLRNVEFRNFIPNKFRQAGALGVHASGPFLLETKNQYTNLKFTNSNNVYLHNRAFDDSKGWGVLDLDGSITGYKKGAWIVSDNSIMRYGKCETRKEWRAAICEPSERGYVLIDMYNLDFSGTNFKDNRGTLHANIANREQNGVFRGAFHKLGSSKGEPMYGRHKDKNSYRYMINLPTRAGYAFKTIHDTPTPSKLSIEMKTSTTTDWVVLSFPYPKGTTFKITYKMFRDTHTMKQVSSIKDLSYETYYYDVATEFLFVKIENRRGNSYSNLWGFFDKTSFGFSVQIEAKCAKNECRISKTNVPSSSLLNNENFNEDVYEAKLEASQHTHTVKSSAEGVAFVSVNHKQQSVNLNVFHSLNKEVKAVKIMEGEKGKAGKAIFTLPSVYSPASFGIYLPNRSMPKDFFHKLSKGMYYITVETDKYKNGELRGQLLCRGKCSSISGSGATVLSVSDHVEAQELEYDYEDEEDDYEDEEEYEEED